MGLQRIVRWAVPLAGVVLLASGCSEEGKRLAMPDPASEQGTHILSLWQGAWIAALATGALVWGLIFFVIIRYHRRSDDEIPVQTRYNLPLEIFYTIAPVIMVVVFFSHTVRTQDLVLKDEPSNPPDNIIEVTGEQWSWTFNYGLGEIDQSADDDRFDDHFSYQSYVHDGGTGSYIPELWLPVDETTRFNLHSPDVIHDFGIPSFLMRMDVVPGRVNHYVITPTRTGTFRGRCYELCGVYHSRMLFTVKVVSRDDYEAHLQDLVDQGLEVDRPLLGGSEAYTQAGLDEKGESE
ncbi:MAG TPA: cytochrome c oxidase subunit II [Nocardioides sp.]|uniref:aa3-type cytochrome oxidase subunit II n=1 Tax=Nocardioides sp. TaxID=35761 RepID=UPI002E367E39|nr:cytochrome c oxidase subunit II [Nocardioides sp.]HEX5089243.1 cytochrome c oxidase subunit II [Nocardioides sp.]